MVWCEVNMRQKTRQTGSDGYIISFQNIVAVGAGFCDGLGFGDNTKAAVIRLGLMEMIAFARLFCTAGSVSPATFLESCGVADLITTCYGGRNRKIGEAFAKTGKVSIRFARYIASNYWLPQLDMSDGENASYLQSIEQLEKEMLNGQKLQGPATAAEVNHILRHKNMVDK